MYVLRNPETQALDAAARQGAPGSFVALRAGTTHYEIAGPASGRVVVLVHGFSVPAYIWDPTFRTLGDAGYRVVRYDLFGRGLSDRPDAASDGAFYDSQLDELLAALRVTQPVDLVGLSFGGFVVAHYASTHPQRVRSLSMVDPVTSGAPLPWFIRMPVIGPYVFQVAAVPGMAESQPSDFLHPERFPDWVERYRPQMRYRGFGRALRRSAMALAGADFDSMYRAVATSGLPVLLVWGRQDRTTPLAGADPVRRHIPSLEFVVVEDAGHLPHLEQPAAFNTRLLAFLERTSTRLAALRTAYGLSRFE